MDNNIVFEFNSHIYISKDNKYIDIGFFVKEIEYLFFYEYPNSMKRVYIKETDILKRININFQISVFLLENKYIFIDFKNKIIFNDMYIEKLIGSTKFSLMKYVIKIKNGNIIKVIKSSLDEEKILLNLTENLCSSLNIENFKLKLIKNKKTLTVKEKFSNKIDIYKTMFLEFQNTEIINCLEIIKYSFYINSFYNSINNIRNILLIAYSYIYENHNHFIKNMMENKNEFYKNPIYWSNISKLEDISLDELSNLKINNSLIISYLETSFLKEQKEIILFKKIRDILNNSIHRNHYDKEEFYSWELGKNESNILIEILDFSIKILNFSLKPDT